MALLKFNQDKIHQHKKGTKDGPSFNSNEYNQVSPVWYVLMSLKVSILLCEAKINNVNLAQRVKCQHNLKYPLTFTSDMTQNKT